MTYSLVLLRFPVTGVTSESSRYRKLAEFVADHVFRYQHGYMLTAVVNGDSQADHVGQNHRTP